MIHKFVLGLGTNALEVGRDSVVLSVTDQRNRAVAYIDNDPPEPKGRGWIIVLYVAETGDEAPGGKFIGTVVLEDGNSVLHVFQREALQNEPTKQKP